MSITLPILPLKDTHIFPGMIIPVVVGFPESLHAIEVAVQNYSGKIICLMQKVATGDNYPTEEKFYETGFICKITQLIKMPDKKIRVLLKGGDKVRIEQFFFDKKSYLGFGNIIPEIPPNKVETEVLKERLRSQTIEYLKQVKGSKPDFFDQLIILSDAYELFYFVCMNVDLSIEEKQELISEDDFLVKAVKLLRMIGEKMEFFKIQRSIDSQVLGKISKLQREHFLSEQLKLIHKELGIGGDSQSDVTDFKEKFDKLPLSEEARKKVAEEIKKLGRITVHSPEYFVVYNYLTWISDLPWQKPESKDIDINEAEQILNNDHYGLEKIKDRILEYLAVIQFNSNCKAQILCFVGPPGVGKTSLGKSIAKALGREFVRISVGGITDESEIRGHRKTYIGSMPGIIIQSLKKSGTINTLIMIDEIDKLGKDFKGDPASALLEVLDPEQNSTFRDHFLDFAFDLSNIFFITTANNLSTIPPALQDRMEIIRLSSYTEHEKTYIAKDFIIPKKIEEFATKEKINIKIPDKSIKSLIRNYTAEAGVRELERHINAIFRKSIKLFLKSATLKTENKPKKPKPLTVTVDSKTLKEYLGVPIFTDKDLLRKNAIGVAYGLAWTAVGGEILPVEVTKYSGSGKFQMTGNIGKVMNESAKAAISFIHHNHKKLGVKPDIFKKYDLHVHIPEGAVPKDGPSAGITLTVAMLSTLINKPVNHAFAMTGEISLTGKVMPVGGLTEKVIAAQRYGFKYVILPKANKKNYDEIKPEAKDGLEAVFVDDLEKAISMVILKEHK